MSNTTTIQNPRTIRKSSVKILIGEDFNSLVDIGAIRTPEVSHLAENQDIEFDNVAPLKTFVKGDRVQVSFELAEINLETIAKLDDGMVNYSTVAGTPVNNANQTIVSGNWNFEDVIFIANQNGDKSPVNVDSVTGSVDGALDVDVDYHIVEVDGKTGIVLHNTGSAGLSTLAQNIVIVYDYTPNASKVLTFNNRGQKLLKCMRLINIDENDKEFRIDIKDGSNFSPITIDFAGDEENDVAIQSVEFQGTLVEYVDEQDA